MEPAKNQITLLTIEGMSCAGCVKTVENALIEQPGVSAASVSLAQQTAAVDGVTDVSLLVKAVEGAGYSARLLQGEPLDDQDSQISAVFRRGIVRSSLALMAGILLMLDMYLPFLPHTSLQAVWIPIGILTLGIMIFTGGHFFRGAFSALANLNFTMDTLVALGTGTAWVFSMMVIIAPRLITEDSQHLFFEAALFVIGFVNLGKALEVNARSRSSLAIQKLFDLTPKFVVRVEGSEESLAPLDEIVVNDVLRVRPGENVSVDGEVLSGTSSVDESMLSGESEDVAKTQRSQVYAGTLNREGSLLIKATGIGADTVLSDLVRLVREAQNSKPPIARLVDNITSVFVPLVMLMALVTAAYWLNFGPEPQLSLALTTAMSVLIIACPCALGLAIPMSIMVGLGRGAASGLLIKNSDILQTAVDLTVVVVDKTGTLTKGSPAVVTSSELSDRELELASAISALSEHPLAVAITTFVGRSAGDAVENFSSEAGGGISGEVSGELISLGNRNFLTRLGIDSFPEVRDPGSIVYLAQDNSVRGYFLLQDKLRVEAQAVVRELQTNGRRVVMLSGDREQLVKDVASQLGIDECYAEQDPEQKLALIRRMQMQGEVVGMVGDGVNDAAALAAADVGFAMGRGTDIAVESADVTLRGNDLSSVTKAIELSARIAINIRQNLAAAFAYNVVLIPIAAGLLYPTWGILISPSLAGFAMAMSSITVVLNANRLRFDTLS